MSDAELATRLSYFLWSSTPDAELHAVAASGKLRAPDGLIAQTQRMLGDARVRRMATEFGCAWLHIHGFDSLDEKSERHFPTFKEIDTDKCFRLRSNFEFVKSSWKILPPRFSPGPWRDDVFAVDGVGARLGGWGGGEQGGE